MRFLGLIISLSCLFLSSQVLACVNPPGIEGQVIQNGGYDVPQYCDGVDWIAMTGADPRSGGGDYKPNAIDFQGSEYLNGVSNIAPNSKLWTGSFWINLSSINGAAYGDTVYNIAVRHMITVRSDGTLRFIGYNTSGSVVLDIHTDSATSLSIGDWHHVLYSFDMSDPSKRHVYIDGVPAALTVSHYSDDILQHSHYNTAIASTTNGIRSITGDLADFWMDMGTYIDLSVEANRRKFIKANGNPAYLGENGELPTGSSPDIFLSGDTADWHTNKGTGGGFTENGTLTTAASTPYTPRTDVVPSGLVGHWRLDETNGTIAYDSSGNGNDATLANMNFSTDSVQGLIGNGLQSQNESAPYERLEISDVSGFPSGVGAQFSVSFWLNPKEISYDWPLMIGHDSSGLNDWLKVSTTDESSGLLEWEGEAKNFNPSFTLGAWNHIVLLQDATNIKIYVNGVYHHAFNHMIEPTSPTEFKLITSATSQTRVIPGQWDDVRIYNRALTEDEIQEIYNARDGIRYNADHRVMEYFDGNRWVSMTPAWADVTDGLVAHWKLDETSGTTMKDSSGNGHDGTLAGTGFDFDTYSVRGAVGNALFFPDLEPDTNFTSSSITAPINMDSNDTFTYAGWVRRPSMRLNGANLRIFGNAGDIELRMGSSLTLAMGSGTDLVGTTVLATDTWHHYAITYDASTHYYALYLNGSLEADATDPAVSFNRLPRVINWPAHGFEGAQDDIRMYSRVLAGAEIQKLYQMGAPIGTNTALPQGCPNVGDVCDDGTIYAGLSEDGSGPEMFVNIHDIQAMPWNDGNSSDYVTVSGTDYYSGVDNVNLILPIDADSGAAGFQSHQAAQYCFDMLAHSADDWYLPADGELHRALTVGYQHDIEAFRYWSSHERSPNGANHRYLTSDGSIATGWYPKHASNNVICVRKGPAPRCANPYGVEGQMTYNTDYDVVQYCDGARWVAIGKFTPPADPCSGSPTPGTTCADGTIYAGDHPTLGVPLYTTAADQGQFTWNNGTSNHPATGATSYTDGKANTDILVALSGASAPYEAAVACRSLGGDWYLPAFDELNILYTNRAAIGGFVTDFYFSSTDNVSQYAVGQWFLNGMRANGIKEDTTRHVRCIRR